MTIDLDPDSRGFSWSDHPGPYGFLDEQHVRQFDADGFCVLKEALDSSLLEQVAIEVDRLERERDAWLADQPAGRSWISQAGILDFAPRLVSLSPQLRSFSASRPLVDVCRDLIGPHVRVTFDQAVYKRRGERTTYLPWHQDNGYNFKVPEDYLTIWIPFQDVDRDNGCMWAVPRAHRYGTRRHQRTNTGFLVCEVDDSRAVPIPARAGDIVVLSSLLPHASGPNRSSAVRRAYLLMYAADGTRLRDGTPCDAPQSQFLVLRDGSPTLFPQD
jgi:ectoine hydroxylase-related dioxygenase (phytanoyl-CoA dioxygenase family)